MPIRIEEAPDPLSGLTPTSTSQPILAESDAYRLLVHDMERYVLRRVTGRSFLISGHRGSGKTTLVLKAVHDLRARFRGESGGRMPLLVRLTGPDLLPDPKRAVEESRAKARQAAGKASDGTPEAAAADDSPAAPESEPEVALAERALRQITLAIYRALAAEFSRAYGDALADSITESFDPFETRVPLNDFAARHLELAAQFRLALDDAPGPALLRELYRLGGFLASGVLFRRTGGPWLFGQGLRELVVLASAAQAYRVVSGDYETKQTAKADATDELARSLSVAPSGAAAFKDLARQLLAVFFGGVVGAGVLFSDEKGLAAALAAIAAAGVASFGFKLTASRTRKRAFTDEYTFIRSHDASTLERELPVLVERLHDAGLAPIFLVDELDKVDDLAERMESVVDHLKHFVSEGAFFCFLTDRDYFEHLRFRALREPYPREHTYFTHRLFVVHRPNDWHAYLHKTLTVTGTERADVSDAPALRYYLLHQARMHPVDLRRELRALRGPTDDALLGPGEVRSQLGYRFAITAQLAVELVLTYSDVKARLGQEPAFTQPMFDALYYPSRMWAEGGAELDVSKEAFVRYLSERMSPNRPRHATAPPPLAAGHAQPPAPPKRRPRRAGADAPAPPEAAGGGSPGLTPTLPIGPSDIDFLLQQARAVTALLTDPRQLAAALQQGASGLSLPSEVIEAIPVTEELRLLQPVSDGVYRWRYDAFGIALPGTRPATPTPQPDRRPTAERERRRSAGGSEALGAEAASPAEVDALAALREEIVFIRQLDESVREVSLDLYRLADELFILSRTPSWPQVESAMGRLVHYLDIGRSYPDLDRDRSLVVDYGAMVRRRGKALAMCLAYGAYVGRSVVQSDTEYLARGVEAVSRGYDLRSAATDEALEVVLSKLPPVVATWLSGVPPIAVETLASWIGSMRKLVTSPVSQYQAKGIEEARIEAWKLWDERLRRFLLSGETRFDPDLFDLLCLAANVPPAAMLPLDLSGMSLAAWSATLKPFVSSDRGKRAEAPGWLAAPVLIQLGLGARLRDHAPGWLPGGVGEWIELVARTRPRALEPRPTALILARTVFIPPSPRDNTALRTDITSWAPSERFGAFVHEGSWELRTGAEDLKLLVQLFSQPEDEHELLEPFSALENPPAVLFIQTPIPDYGRGLASFLGVWRNRQQAIFLLADQESDLLKDVKLPLPTPPRAIIGAKSLDDAMERALRLLSERRAPEGDDRIKPRA